ILPFLYSSGLPPHLPSFPTRRSSDLAQLAYAAADVAHLLEIWRRQHEALEARGRLAWAEAEFAELRSRARISRPPDEAWTRIKRSEEHTSELQSRENLV